MTWQSTLAWFKTHSIKKHTLIAAWGVVMVLWATNPAFKDYIYSLYSHSPAWMHDFIVGIVIPLLAYWRSKSE